MGQEDASHGHNMKPQQSDDEDSDFPEFEFPVGDVADTSVLAVPEQSAHVENGNGTFLLRAHIDESPKKMPLAARATDENGYHSTQLQGRLTARFSEEATQPEIRKHVVAEESKIPTPVQPASVPQRKVLSSNPSFKSLVTSLGEPLTFRTPSMERKPIGDVNGVVAGEQSGETGHKAALSTPSSKRLSGILSRVSARVAAQAAAPASTTPERTRPATSTLSVNVLVEKFSTGMRSKIRDGARPLSPNPSPRNLASPRRTMADRSRSPTPRNPNPTTPRTTTSSPRRAVVPVERSLSPVPRSSWKDSIYGDTRRPKPDPSTMPPPRFLTPTRAAALKAVKPPANPNSKSLQFTTAFGITTPVKDLSVTVPTVTKSIPTVIRSAPAVTEPAGFNFRTNERAERRKDFYSKLEERLKLKEAERKRAEAKALEEKESQLRELRKSLTYKANPVPRFYQEPAPAPAEIRKTAPTRAKSPNFTAPRRRDSCPGSTVSEHFGSGRTSPLRSRTLLRCASLESNSGSHGSLYKAPLPKPKQPFRPV